MQNAVPCNLIFQISDQTRGLHNGGPLDIPPFVSDMTGYQKTRMRAIQSLSCQTTLCIAGLTCLPDRRLDLTVTLGDTGERPHLGFFSMLC